MLLFIVNQIKDLGFFNKSRTVLFISLLFIALFLVFNLKLGVILTAGLILILIGLLKPFILYLLFLSLFSLEAFSAVSGVSYPRILGIFLTLALTLRLLLRKETIPKDDSYKYFFLFFLGNLVSFAFAINISISTQVYVTYIFLFLLYILTRYFLITEKDIHTALNYLFFGTLASFVYLYIMGIEIFVVVAGVPRVGAGMGDSNEYASYILVLLPLAIYRAMNTEGRLKLLYSSLGLIYFVILVYTGSRGGILGFLGALVVFIQYYGIKKLKSVFVVLLLLSVSIFVFSPEGYLERATTITTLEKDEASRDTRIENYHIALKMFLDRPLAGFGMNNFQFSSLDYGALRSMVVHNTYLEILVGGGLLSFIPFLLILMNIWKKLKIKNKYKKNIYDLMVCLKASFVSILITSFFLTAGHKKILWFLFALISSVYNIAAYQRISYKVRDSQ